MDYTGEICEVTRRLGRWKLPKVMSRQALSDLQARLARQIVDYIVKNQLHAGRHLTEETLAREFGVSRSPVWHALRYLGRKGVVEAQPNRGFFVAKSAHEIDADSLGVPNASDQRLFERIMRDRVTGKLTDVLTEAEFMRRYRVSRGVLRQALQQLSSQGIMQRTQGYGWSFLPSVDSEQAYEESYQFRMLIEPAGILEAKFKVEPAAFARVRATHRRMLDADPIKASLGELFEANVEFHETVAACSGNRYILQAVQQQNRYRRSIEYTGLISAERIAISCREHLAILDALELGDRKWAANLMHRHIQVASEIKSAYAKQPADPVSVDGPRAASGRRSS